MKEKEDFYVHCKAQWRSNGGGAKATSRLSDGPMIGVTYTVACNNVTVILVKSF